MKSICGLLITAQAILGLFNAICIAAEPREPLTFANTGLYCAWNEYLVSPDSPFDFLIIQANVIDGKIETGRWHKDGDDFSWNDFVKLARAGGKRVIADVSPIVTDLAGKQQSLAGLYHTENPLPIERFTEMFDRFFEQVDEQDLYAVTITEENVFWNGQQERLKHVYEYLKQRYDVPVYQWYSPSQSGATPGLTFPNLPADGWAVDEYFLQKPLIEHSMRMYTILQKPAFQIIWAAPDMPSVPWSERTFWDQFETCRKYNVPIAFFCWNGQDDTPASDTWGWKPNASLRMRQTFEDYVLHAARLAKELPPVSQAEWDLMPAGRKQVKLTVEEARPNYAIYRDTFAKEREIGLWLDTTITGFAHLKWDSSPIQLKPRSAGDVESTIRYCFDSPRKIRRIVAGIEASTSGGGSVELKLASMNGQMLAESTVTGDRAEIDFSASEYTDTRFVLTVTLAGTATQSGQVLAKFAGVSVEAELAGN